MRTILLTSLLLAALIGIPAASASLWPKDPRVCSYTPGTPGPRAQCAGDAAKRAVRAKAGDGQIACTQGATLLRWSCVWGGSTTYRVVFTHSKLHWWVSVTQA